VAVGQPPRDPVVTLYRTLLGCAAAGILILAAGIGEFVYFEPFAQSSGTHADISGVYSYDPSTQQTSGPNRTSFHRTEQFAAVVDWKTLPGNIQAQAIWYDGFGNVVGQVGPASPGELADRSTIPAELPHGLTYHLPGQYIFAVERLESGLPVEVLARRLIEVTRS
jgi:hypothetical protein